MLRIVYEWVWAKALGPVSAGMVLATELGTV